MSSSNLVSYSSEEEEEEDANYDDVGMDVSNDDSDSSSSTNNVSNRKKRAKDESRAKDDRKAEAFANKEEYLAYKSQFGEGKKEDKQKSEDKSNSSEYGGSSEYGTAGVAAPPSGGRSEYGTGGSEYGGAAASTSDRGGDSEYGSSEPVAKGERRDQRKKSPQQQQPQLQKPQLQQPQLQQPQMQQPQLQQPQQQQPQDMDLEDDDDEKDSRQRHRRTDRVSAGSSSAGSSGQVNDRLLHLSRGGGGGTDPDTEQGGSRPPRRDRRDHRGDHHRDDRDDKRGGDRDRRRRSRDRGQRRRSRSPRDKRSRSRSRDRNRRGGGRREDNVASGRNIQNEETRSKAELRNRKLEAMGIATTAAAAQMAGGESQAAIVKEMTGVELPKYYNASVINPLKYADQVLKKQRLWGNKNVDPCAMPSSSSLSMAFTAASSCSSAAAAAGEPEEQSKSKLPAGVILPPNKSRIPSNSPFKQSFNKWEKTNFGDNAANEKFRSVIIPHSHASSFVCKPCQKWRCQADIFGIGYRSNKILKLWSCHFFFFAKNTVQHFYNLPQITWIKKNVHKLLCPFFCRDCEHHSLLSLRRLMGIKNPAPATAAPSDGGGPEDGGDDLSSVGTAEKTKALFSAQEEQYERARAITHTAKGLGLGFGSMPPP
jgi:hypothetical protein